MTESNTLEGQSKLTATCKKCGTKVLANTLGKLHQRFEKHLAISHRPLFDLIADDLKVIIANLPFLHVMRCAELNFEFENSVEVTMLLQAMHESIEGSAAPGKLADAVEVMQRFRPQIRKQIELPLESPAPAPVSIMTLEHDNFVPVEEDPEKL